MSKLILVRHGQSEWNALGLWTGWKDVNLNAQGILDAHQAGEAIQDINLDVAFVSALKRAQDTLSEIKKVIHQEDIPTIVSDRLNERDYGELTGKNKWKIKEEYGEDQFMRWRRSWDEAIPGGESLKDVYARVIPYYENTILSELKNGKNVIIAAHGNSLRALIKYLENIADTEISKLEVGLGEIYIYTVDAEGKITAKEMRAVNLLKGKI